MAKQRVIGYTRVSTTEQVDGFGLDVQEAAIRAYCKSEISASSQWLVTKASRVRTGSTIGADLLRALLE